MIVIVSTLTFKHIALLVCFFLFYLLFFYWMFDENGCMIQPFISCWNTNEMVHTSNIVRSLNVNFVLFDKRYFDIIRFDWILNIKCIQLYVQCICKLVNEFLKYYYFYELYSFIERVKTTNENISAKIFEWKKSLLLIHCFLVV